jgi:hypothetical protein
VYFRVFVGTRVCHQNNANPLGYNCYNAYHHIENRLSMTLRGHHLVFCVSVGTGAECGLSFTDNQVCTSGNSPCAYCLRPGDTRILRSVKVGHLRSRRAQYTETADLVYCGDPMRVSSVVTIVPRDPSRTAYPKSKTVTRPGMRSRLECTRLGGRLSVGQPIHI